MQASSARFTDLILFFYTILYNSMCTAFHLKCWINSQTAENEVRDWLRCKRSRRRHICVLTGGTLPRPSTQDDVADVPNNQLAFVLTNGQAAYVAQHIITEAPDADSTEQASSLLQIFHQVRHGLGGVGGGGAARGLGHCHMRTCPLATDAAARALAGAALAGAALAGAARSELRLASGVERGVAGLAVLHIACRWLPMSFVLNAPCLPPQNLGNFVMDPGSPPYLFFD